MKKVKNVFISKTHLGLHFGKRINFTKFFTIICTIITTAIVFYIGCCCFSSILRFASSVVDLATSLAYYFNNFFVVFSGTENAVPATVVQIPQVNSNALLPQQYEQFLAKIHGFGAKFISTENLENFFSMFPVWLYNFSIILMFALPMFLLLYALFQMYLSGQNNDWDVSTKSLLQWKKFENNVLSVIKNFLTDFKSFVVKRKLHIVWLLLMLLGMNIYTFVLEVLAYLFYFVSSFDLVGIYTQFYKLFVDIDIALSSLPAIVWCGIFAKIITVIRKHIGMNRLHHMESCNCGYIRSFGVCTMITGNMGTGKTKLMTDMSLSLSSEYKYNCKNILFDVERWFPYFPWATVQNELKIACCFHQVYSLTTAEIYARKKKQRFEKRPCKATIYGYDFKRYGLFYNNELKLLYLFEVLEEYCKAFFVYYLSSSLLVGNYSVREDGIMNDIGNMPLWDYDYFRRSPTYENEISYYAHVLDFDVLRKGKKVVKGSKFADTFEFGIVVITELDKERGNTQDTKELKKVSDEANQKNDLFNYSPKMGRHPATIMYQPFIRFLVDQQRAMKTDADFREICDKVINIEEVKKDKFCLPLFFVEDLLYSILKPRFDDLYENYRFNRADNSLIMYFLKNTIVRFINWYERQNNLFGYDLYTLATDSGKLDGENLQKDKYFLLHKKALSHRYSTDCYKDFFRQKTAKKKIGIADYPTFAGVTATAEELKSMNSYFINDMVNKICAEEAQKGE